MQHHPQSGNKLKRKLRDRSTALLTSMLCGAVIGLNGGQIALADPSSDWGPKWTSDGKLKLPTDFHQWVFLGAPLTPQGLNDGKAGFPEYHNVYIQPEAYQAYRRSGEFPEGTILLKELQLTQPGTYEDGSRNEPSGRGYFPGKLNGIDISVKDSKKFKNTDGWGFFNYGHSAPPYAKTATLQPKEACAACHEANATDMVFIKFYSPILNAK